MNPLLAVEEYESAPSKDGTRRKRKLGGANPFLDIPEYEGGTLPGVSSAKLHRKRKFERDPSGLPSRLPDFTLREKLDKEDRLGPTSLDGKSEKGPAQPSNKNPNVDTFSKNYNKKGKAPKNIAKQSKGLLKNGGRSFHKQNGVRTSSSVNGPQKEKQNMPVNNRNVPGKKKKKPRTPKNRLPNSKGEQAGPITWGLSGSSWAESQTLSLDSIGGFNWNATPDDFAKIASTNGMAEEESEESEDEVVVKGKKLTPAEKRAKALEEEKNMKKKEKELIEAEDDPRSPDHFERLLIGSPNSAELWIKYMGFHAVNADIEKARAVAQRAIKRIDPQLTSARLDVWIAFLNLDFNFSPPDVFKETFSEAIKCNDDYAINSRVLSLYAEAENATEVDQLANTMVRKYKDKVENWLHCQNALMMVGLPDKARYMLQKALSILNKKSHVTLISRFALLENKYGFSEQAEALFENLLTSYPQRVDLLNVYVDMLVKSSRVDLARSILERASNNHLPVRKMKSIYTKWISFEEAHGTPSDVSKVEEAAQKYVSRVMKSANQDASSEAVNEKYAENERRADSEDDDFDSD